MVSQALAQVARPVRCASDGASRSNDSSSAEIRSGASARLRGHRAGPRDVGQQRHGQRVPAAQRASAGSRSGPATPARASSSALSAGSKWSSAVHGHHVRASPGRPARPARAARGRPAPRRLRRASAGRARARSQPSIGAELLVAVDQQRPASPHRSRAGCLRRRARKPSGDGSTSRPSSVAPPRRPAAPGPGAQLAAAAWSCRCRPGRGRTAPGAATAPATASSKLASSPARPTKPCHRTSSTTSPSLAITVSVDRRGRLRHRLPDKPGPASLRYAPTIGSGREPGSKCPKVERRAGRSGWVTRRPR